MINFFFEANASRPPLPADSATFRVARLWSQEAGSSTELSHMIDRTYDYNSVRELRWHLAERFARPLADLTLEGV